jgi:hypothetical protein
MKNIDCIPGVTIEMSPKFLNSKILWQSLPLVQEPVRLGLLDSLCATQDQAA